jgi:hypothetical protein
MKSKISFILLVTLLCALSAHAQKLGFSVNVNYGNYKMKEIRAFENEMIKSFPVKAKSMSSFPAFVGYEGKLFLSFEKFNVGVFGSFNSTGSRISYKDYSGRIDVDQLARLKAIGALVEYKIPVQSEVWKPFLSLQMSIGKTTYDLDASVELDNETLTDESLVFESKHTLINPSFGLRRQVLKKCFVAATVGYLFDSAADLKYKRDNDLYLLNEDNDPVSLDWSGFRLGMSFGVRM